MFTGIIEAVGRIGQTNITAGDMQLKVLTGQLDLADVQPGDSIATQGVCLTVTRLDSDGFCADVSTETLSTTTLRKLSVGDRVNLEKALTPSTRMGGHMVTGHVDGVGKIVQVEPDSRSIIYWIETPAELVRYIVRKGSVTVDGISLTVNRVEGGHFALSIVPHTQEKTTLAHCGVGTEVNLEVDIVARYLEGLLSPGQIDCVQEQPATVTTSLLAEHGFMK